MITVENYNQQVTGALLSKLPAPLQRGHENMKDMLPAYGMDAEVDNMILQYIAKLNEYVAKAETKKKQPDAPASQQRYLPALVNKPAKKTATKRKKPTTNQPPGGPETNKPKKKAVKKPKNAVSTNKRSTKPTSSTAKKKPADNAKAVSHLSAEVRIIKRIKNMHDKVQSSKQIAAAVKAMQRMILRKEIRKTSPYADEIKSLQNLLVHFHNGMKGTTEKFNIPDALYKKVNAIAGEEKVRESVRLISRYIGLLNTDNLQAMQRLLSAIEAAISKNRITSSDPYFAQIKAIISKLESAIAKNVVMLQATETELSGLQGILRKFNLKSSLKKKRA